MDPKTVAPCALWSGATLAFHWHQPRGRFGPVWGSILDAFGWILVPFGGQFQMISEAAWANIL